MWRAPGVPAAPSATGSCGSLVVSNDAWKATEENLESFFNAVRQSRWDPHCVQTTAQGACFSEAPLIASECLSHVSISFLVAV